MIKFSYKTKVYYRDVDQMGVVYYTRYYEYFEAARTELLQSIALDVTSIEDEGYFLPVITSHCDYKMGANFEDNLLVKTEINKLQADWKGNCSFSQVLSATHTTVTKLTPPIDMGTPMVTPTCMGSTGWIT